MDENSKQKVFDKDSETAKQVLTSGLEIFEDENVKWDCETLETKCQELCAKLDLKPRVFFQPIRVAVAGNMVSPPLFGCIELMKREDIIERMKFALNV